MRGVGIINGCNIFWCQKLAKTFSFVGERIVVLLAKLHKALRLQLLDLITLLL